MQGSINNNQRQNFQIDSIPGQWQPFNIDQQQNQINYQYGQQNQYNQQNNIVRENTVNTEQLGNEGNQQNDERNHQNYSQNDEVGALLPIQIIDDDYFEYDQLKLNKVVDLSHPQQFQEFKELFIQQKIQLDADLYSISFYNWLLFGEAKWHVGGLFIIQMILTLSITIDRVLGAPIKFYEYEKFYQMQNDGLIQIISKLLALVFIIFNKKKLNSAYKLIVMSRTLKINSNQGFIKRKYGCFCGLAQLIVANLVTVLFIYTLAAKTYTDPVNFIQDFGAVFIIIQLDEYILLSLDQIVQTNYMTSKQFKIFGNNCELEYMEVITSQNTITRVSKYDSLNVQVLVGILVVMHMYYLVCMIRGLINNDSILLYDIYQQYKTDLLTLNRLK